MPDFGPNWAWVRDLGEGGQSHTFIVKRADRSDDREYVLKRLKNPKRLDRFEREIEAYEAFDHPNVLRIVAHGADPKGRRFLVTEFCSGGSLAKRVPQLTAPVLEVLQIFHQICAGAAYAQNQERFHRDIKPDNIYFRDDGTAVLGDFGICFADDDGTRLTITEEVAGSRFYCAPELRNGRLDIGIPPGAADVYSLGKVLYWMLSGGQIFDREVHRLEKYQLGRHDPGNPAYELVNELLDSAIVEDWTKRTLGAPQLLERVEGLISVVRAGGHAMTLALPHRCMFCARGEYKVVFDGTRPLPRDAAGQGLERGLRQQQLKSLGFSDSSGIDWIVLICETCGHRLSFHLGSARVNNWLKRSI